MRTIAVLILLLNGGSGIAQHGEISFNLSGGIFNFAGSAVRETSFVNVSDVSSISSYTNNPYGRKSGLSCGFGIQGQRLTRTRFLYGLQMNYESLASKVGIDHANGNIGWRVNEGKATLRNDFLNLFPFAGQRVQVVKEIDTDFRMGFDFAIGLSCKEHFTLTTNQGEEISGTHERKIPKIDFRPRVEMVNYYNNFGLAIGYSYGLTNYLSGLTGGNPEARSRYLRFALCYRI